MRLFEDLTAHRQHSAIWVSPQPFAAGLGRRLGEWDRSPSCLGVVWVPRRVFQRALPERPTPERCVEAYYLQRTRFESIAERKLRERT